jgi:hypothetical protein
MPFTQSLLSVAVVLLQPTLSQLAIARIGIAIKQVYSVWKQGRLAIARILRSKPAAQADCSLIAQEKQMSAEAAACFSFCAITLYHISVIVFNHNLYPVFSFIV